MKLQVNVKSRKVISGAGRIAVPVVESRSAYWEVQ